MRQTLKLTGKKIETEGADWPSNDGVENAICLVPCLMPFAPAKGHNGHLCRSNYLIRYRMPGTL